MRHQTDGWFGSAIILYMKDKTLRVLRWRGYRWMREVSILIREFFTPREIRMMMDGYQEEKGYEDYPIDLCRPKMISEKTLSKLVKPESLDNKIYKVSKAVAVLALCMSATGVCAQDYSPKIHGILRGKYEYQPEMEASRFEVRNARLSAEGSLPMRAAYKLEVDLCDESAMKMKDAWVRMLPWKSLRLTFGQQRMPFSIDAHRNPSAQYFANRSFIAKQVGDMRDVGFQIGYDFYAAGDNKRKVVSVDAGVFNGSNLDNQKTAWFSGPSYSARIQYFPVSGWVIVPSIQHQKIAERKAAYTSLDFGSFYEKNGWHIEAEYLHKSYDHDMFDDCNALDAMVIYKQGISQEKAYFNGVSYLLRYDFMNDHSDGKKGLVSSEELVGRSEKLVLSDYERHRFTAGLTFHIDNKYFPTDLRLNYEKYWYPNGGKAKESEQDKVVCELMIRF